MKSQPETPLPSERSFGLLFSGVAGVAALWLSWRGHFGAAAALAVIGLGFLAAGLFAPTLLAVPNRLWFKLGMLLNAVVSPIVLGAIFFLIITPVGIIRRLRSEPLRLKYDPRAASYWIARDNPAVAPDTFKNQF